MDTSFLGQSIEDNVAEIMDRQIHLYFILYTSTLLGMDPFTTT
jgi:hypothetical protein